MKHKYIPSLLGAIAVSLFCTSSGNAGDNVPAHTAMEGRVLERTMIGDPLNFGVPFVHVLAESEGISTHWGRTTMTYEYTAALHIIDGVPTVIADGRYESTTANGSIGGGTFRNVQIYGQTTFTTEAWEDNGGYYTGAGQSFADGSFQYASSGTIPNRGQAKK